VLNEFRPANNNQLIWRPARLTLWLWIATASKLQIRNGVVRISAGMVGILRNSRSPIERQLQQLTPESRLLRQNCWPRTLSRRVQGAMSYKFRTKLDFNKEVSGNS
jgi:hypothetical protein